MKDELREALKEYGMHLGRYSATPEAKARLRQQVLNAAVMEQDHHVIYALRELAGVYKGQPVEDDLDDDDDDTDTYSEG